MTFKTWYEKNKEKRHQYYLDNKEKYLERGKKWKKDNPEKVKAQRKRHRLRKRK